MLNKKALGLAALALFAFSSSVSAEYKEISCSSDPLFEQYSCNQCFDWGAQKAWANIGFLNDIWKNDNDNKQILYKDEQVMPVMNSINKTVWEQIPSSENFWEYTKELEKYYNSDEDGYILPAKTSVSWLQSKEGYAYNLKSTNAKKGDPVWLLVYTIKVHNIEWQDNIKVEPMVHKECVLFKSASSVKTEAPVVKQKPKKLPKTWPEDILLLILAMILAFGVLKFSRKNS